MKKRKKARPHFLSVPLAQANRRAGKHQEVVYHILSDLATLDEHSAVRIDLMEVGEKKAELRAALHRAANRERVKLATTSDEKYLYVFRPSLKNDKNQRFPH
jgi:hypothetical protein